MVKYELQVLEHMVLSRTTLVSKSVLRKPDQTNSTPSDIASEVDRIKQTLLHDLFTFSHDRHLRRYIQLHQHAIMQLIDKLPSGQDHQQTHDGFQCLLEDLLNFIQLQFPKYFDWNARLPRTCLHKLQTRISEQARIIADLLVTRGADPQLVDTIMEALHQIEAGHCTVDYKMILYAEEIKKVLQQILEKQYAGVDLEDAIRRVMISCNYNSARCFYLYTRHIKDELDLDNAHPQKIDRLSLFKRAIAQSLIKPGLRFDPESPSLANQLTTFIDQEMHHQQRIQSIDIRPEVKNNFQIQFEASVAQMAYMVKIFTHAGVIVNSNTTELLRFVSGCIITRRSGQVSYDSIRSKYYNVEESTRQSVKVMLENVIKHLDKDK